MAKPARKALPNTLGLGRAMAGKPGMAERFTTIAKSTAIDMSEIASFSVSPCMVVRKLRVLRNAPRMARSIEDF
jgi:hypothetical protein